MWNNEDSQGDVALLSVPIAWMGDGSRTVPRSRYRHCLRSVPTNGISRIASSAIISSTAAMAISAGSSRCWSRRHCAAARWRSCSCRTPVERLDQLGDDGVVIGNDPRGGLTFTAVDLRRPLARDRQQLHLPRRPAGREPQPGLLLPARHADGSSGLLGLPITTELQSQYARFLGSGSSILFLKRQNRLFDMAGRLDADPRGAVDDACVASCVDWYGNARPIFIGNRVFALMGYELVEGQLARGAIHEGQKGQLRPADRGCRCGASCPKPRAALSGRAMADKTPTRRNRPALALHVPEPSSGPATRPIFRRSKCPRRATRRGPDVAA
jgi:hypothetical protein